MLLEKIDIKNYIAVCGKCRDCENPVSHYTCNESLVVVRPEAKEWDWWSACDNKDCINHYGEGVFQDKPLWELTITARG